MKIENNILLKVEPSDLTNGHFAIPENITSIGDGAFNDCPLTSVTLPVGLRSIGNRAFCGCRLTSFDGKPCLMADGEVFLIENKKEKDDITILKGKTFLGRAAGEDVTGPCYVAQKGEFYAHGKTPKEAVKDLTHKIYVAEIQQTKINPDDIITPELYHYITGACNLGIKSWMEQHDIEDKEYTAREVAELLTKFPGYGAEKFKELLK